MTRIRRWTVLAGTTLTALFVGGPAAFASLPVPDPNTVPAQPTHLTATPTGTTDWTAWVVAAVAAVVVAAVITLALRAAGRHHRLAVTGATG